MKEKLNISLLILLALVFFILRTGNFAIADSSKVIKIGAAIPLTGQYSSDGIDYLSGLKMAVEEINEKGGLLGLTLQIIHFDTQDLTQEIVMSASHQLVKVEKVHCIHAGLAGTGQDYRAYGRYEIPTFVKDASEDAIKVFRESPDKYSNMFMVAPIEKDHANETMVALQQIKFNLTNNNIAIINADDKWCRRMGEGIEKVALKNGWETVLHEVVPYGNRNWLPILKLIRESRPAYIHFEVLSTPDMITFFQQFMQAPTSSVLNFSYGATFADFRIIMDNKINGLLGASSGFEILNHATAEISNWLLSYNRKYGEDAGPSSWQGYNCLMVWADAVKKTGTYDNFRKINNYIANHTFKNIAGGEWAFNEDQLIPFSEKAPWILFQIQNGKPAAIYSTNGKKNKTNQFIPPPWIFKQL
ncbi:MAG: ABC transporter substrate-binding protein [Desulfobacterales bacterium]|nr:ABC transporter substrate-binding protein [Desulfobacterales bacterium]